VTHDEEKVTPLTHCTTSGSYYLQGFTDGYHGRQQVKHQEKEAREAYMNGYNQGIQSAKQDKKGA
jgi:hypothetical protein